MFLGSTGKSLFVVIVQTLFFDSEKMSTMVEEAVEVTVENLKISNSQGNLEENGECWFTSDQNFTKCPV